eukprot:UN16389
MEEFVHFIEGINAVIPFEFPGTVYAKCMSSRRKLLKLIKVHVIKAKKMMDDDSEFFVTPIHRMLQAEDETGKRLTMDELTANVLLILFGAEDTTSAVLAAVMKRLHDSEEIFDKLKHEVP